MEQTVRVEVSTRKLGICKSVDRDIDRSLFHFYELCGFCEECGIEAVLSLLTWVDSLDKLRRFSTVILKLVIRQRDSGIRDGITCALNRSFDNVCMVVSRADVMCIFNLRHVMKIKKIYGVAGEYEKDVSVGEFFNRQKVLLHAEECSGASL